MITQPEILHVFSGVEGECRVWDCPCHDFTLKTPPEASSGEKASRAGESENGPPNPSQASKKATSDNSSAQNPPSESETQSNPIPAPTFTQEWHDAPRWATRLTEQQVAEYWFIRGQHAKEVELLAGMNLDLHEMVRVARERIGR